MEILAVLGFFVIAWISYAMSNAALKDKGNQTTIYVNQIQDICQLDAGPVEAILIRQSGYEYRDLGVFEDAGSAIAEILKSFNRAQIDSLRVHRNTSTELKVHRLFHSHRGKAEGKKLGGAILRSLA